MNEQHEYQLRRRAIRLTLQGHTRQAILARIPRSPAWLSKWLHRFDELGWQGLRARPRAPLHLSTRYSEHTRHLVAAARGTRMAWLACFAHIPPIPITQAAAWDQPFQLYSAAKCAGCDAKR